MYHFPTCQVPQYYSANKPFFCRQITKLRIYHADFVHPQTSKISTEVSGAERRTIVCRRRYYRQVIYIPVVVVVIGVIAQVCCFACKCSLYDV